MTIPEGMRGLDVSCLPESHWEKDTTKSRLLIQARILWETDQRIEAREHYAAVAVLEEELMQECLEVGVIPKFFVHAFSAIHSWVKASNAHRAFQICRAILERPEITPPLQGKAELLLAAIQEGQRAFQARFEEKNKA